MVNKTVRRVLYVSRNDGTDTRMSKECNSLAAAGYEVVVLGWDRSPQTQKSNPMPDIEKHILRHPAGFRSLSLLLSVWKYYFFLLKTMVRLKPDIVHVVNEDLALMVAPLKPILGFRLVCDIYDSFQLRYASANMLVRGLARLLCRCSWMASDAILVTDQDRLDRLQLDNAKTRVVPNYPVDPGEFKLPALEQAAARTYLYVAGTLYEARGLRQIQDVLDKQQGVYAICAGWLYDECAEQFSRHEKVEYLGVITPAESLAYAAATDVVMALYDPVNDNMLLASPNKIYDAMCVGKPVIINSETRVSKWVEEAGVGYRCAYADTASLHSIIAKIQDDKRAQRDSSDHIRRLFETGYSWDVAEREMLGAYNLLAWS